MADVDTLEQYVGFYGVFMSSFREMVLVAGNKDVLLPAVCTARILLPTRNCCQSGPVFAARRLLLWHQARPSPINQGIRIWILVLVSVQSVIGSHRKRALQREAVLRASTTDVSWPQPPTSTLWHKGKDKPSNIYKHLTGDSKVDPIHCSASTTWYFAASSPPCIWRAPYLLLVLGAGDPSERWTCNYWVVSVQRFRCLRFTCVNQAACSIPSVTCAVASVLLPLSIMVVS